MNTIIIAFLHILLAFSSDARSLFKRNNSYGDEAVTSAPPPAIPMPTSVEQYPGEMSQQAKSPTSVEFSGYRKKRNNAYGDETITPSAAPSPPLPEPVEQAPATAYQAAAAPAPLEPGGY